MKSRKRYRQTAAAICGIVLCYMILEGMGITCPILFVTGISCAGCGMSRAWLALLRGDLVAACGYHPLFWLPPAALTVWLCRRRISRRVLGVLGAAAVVLMFVVYILRMMDPTDSVVVFRPGEGLIGRMAGNTFLFTFPAFRIKQ